MNIISDPLKLWRLLLAEHAADITSSVYKTKPGRKERLSQGIGQHCSACLSHALCVGFASGIYKECNEWRERGQM